MENERSQMVFYRADYRQQYAIWRRRLEAADKQPYQEQWIVLDVVHARCEEEHRQEQQSGHALPSPMPLSLLRLIHGLPGSGKTQLMLWLRDYFETVWHWEAGVHFVFLAPLNTMAANISGATLHAFAEIQFKDKKGNMIQSKRQGEDDVSSLHMKCSCLRFVLVDEIEAAGTEVLADLEGNLQRHAPKAFRDDVKSMLPRVWGGLNVLKFGDWWQLPSVGQVCIMSDPFSERVLESARMNHIMSMFWDKDSVNSVQRWEHSGARVLNLTVNKRIGVTRY